MERPELRSAVQSHGVHLGVIQPSITSLARQHRPTTIRARRVPTHVCASEGRAARGQLFDRGDGEAVDYENFDEPVWQDAGDVGER